MPPSFLDQKTRLLFLSLSTFLKSPTLRILSWRSRLRRDCIPPPYICASPHVLIRSRLAPASAETPTCAGDALSFDAAAWCSSCSAIRTHSLPLSRGTGTEKNPSKDVRKACRVVRLLSRVLMFAARFVRLPRYVRSTLG